MGIIIIIALIIILLLKLLLLSLSINIIIYNCNYYVIKSIIYSKSRGVRGIYYFAIFLDFVELFFLLKPITNTKTRLYDPLKSHFL